MKYISLLLISVIAFVLTFCTEKEKVKPVCNSFQITTQTQEASCSGSDGKITVNAVSGNPLEYSLDGTNFQTSNEFEGLAAGSYTVIVKDDKDCSETESVELEEVNDLQIIASPTIAGCGSSNGSLSITSSGGAGNYTFSIDDGAFQSSGDYTGLSSKTYLVRVKDANGCSKSVNVRVPSGISFKGIIKPIIDGNCATTGCHVQGGQSPNFTIFSAIKANAAKIKAKTADKSMPKNGTLTAEQIQQIACWVDDGALDN